MPKAHTRGGKSISIDLLENRRFFSLSNVVHDETVTIGTGSGSAGVTFTASNGRYEGITVGSATATIVFSGLSIPGTVKGHTYFTKGTVETVESITITNAVPYRALMGIRGSYGVGSFDVGPITGGHLSSIIAPDVNLVGNVDLASIGNMIVSSISGASLNLGSSAATVKVNGTMTGSLTVGKLVSLSAKQIVDSTITTNGIFSQTQLQINTINGGSGIKDSQIISAGNIGTVKATFIDGSVIEAAANPTANTAGAFPAVLVPESKSVFTEPAAIHNIQVASTAFGGFFNNSVITADTIGNAHIGQIGPDGGGVAAHTFGAIWFLAPAGSLDLASVHLVQSQLKSSSKLAAALAQKGLTYEQQVLGQYNVEVFGLNLNVLG